MRRRSSSTPSLEYFVKSCSTRNSKNYKLVNDIAAKVPSYVPIKKSGAIDILEPTKTCNTLDHTVISFKVSQVHCLELHYFNRLTTDGYHLPVQETLRMSSFQPNGPNLCRLTTDSYHLSCPRNTPH